MTAPSWSALLGRALAGSDSYPDAPPGSAFQAEADPARRLLLDLTLGVATRRVGATAEPVHVSADPAPEQDVALVPSRAARLLDHMVGQSNPPLIGEWFVLAAHRRIPEYLLPRLLHYGVSHLRNWVHVNSVLGERGRWLASQRPEWRIFAPVSPEVLWESTDRASRVIALRRLRQSDPAKARDLLESTWESLSADHLALLIPELEANLSPDDEEFLERAVLAPGKDVKRAAVRLLVRLPESKVSRAVFERLTPYVELGRNGIEIREIERMVADVRIAMLGEMTPAAEKALPELPIVPVAAVPPDWWLSHWNISMDKLAGAAKSNGPFLNGLLSAVVMHRSVAWAEALQSSKLPQNADLLRLIKPERRDALTADWITKADFNDTGERAVNAGLWFGPRATRAVFDRIKQILRRTYDYKVEYAIGYQLPFLARCVDINEAKKLLDEEHSSFFSVDHLSRVEPFLDTINARIDLHEAFREGES